MAKRGIQNVRKNESAEKPEEEAVKIDPTEILEDMAGDDEPIPVNAPEPVKRTAVALPDVKAIIAEEQSEVEIVVLKAREPAPVVCGFHFPDGTNFAANKRFIVPGNVGTELQECGIASIVRYVK